MPSRSVERGPQSIPECHEWSAVPPGVSGVVGRTFEVSGVDGMPFWSVESGRQALPKSQE